MPRRLETPLAKAEKDLRTSLATKIASSVDSLPNDASADQIQASALEAAIRLSESVEFVDVLTTMFKIRIKKDLSLRETHQERTERLAPLREGLDVYIGENPADHPDYGKDISALGLETVVVTSLRKNGIQTIKDLTETTARDLGFMRNIGEKRCLIIQQKLRKIGLSAQGQRRRQYIPIQSRAVRFEGE